MFIILLVIGAVLANRLTEIAHWNVLLIEAGGNENEISDAPGLRGYSVSKMDWQYKTEPQEHFTRKQHFRIN